MTMTIEPVGSLFVYFRDAVVRASEHQRLETQPETTDYLANLLVTFGTSESQRLLQHSIVLTLDDALARPAGEQLVGLQAVGDGALYLVSFFPDYLARSQLDETLYMNVGAFAYGRAADLARASGTREPRAWIDLQRQFGRIADVLGEVAESSALGNVTKNLVQLFDRWKRTGSSRALEAMARAGVFPGKGDGDAC
jgi:hypothetical protein